MRWIPHNIYEFESEKLDKEEYSSNSCPLECPDTPPSSAYKKGAPVRDTPHRHKSKLSVRVEDSTVLGPSKVPGTPAKQDQNLVVRVKCVHKC